MGLLLAVALLTGTVFFQTAYSAYLASAPPCGSPRQGSRSPG
ncbi:MULTISPECIES: hypothetical protein [Streptomyces]